MRKRLVLLLAAVLLAAGAVAIPAQGDPGGGTTRTPPSGGGGDGGGSGGGGGRANDPDPSASAYVSCEHRGRGVPRFCVADVLQQDPEGITPAAGADLAAAFGLEEAWDDGAAIVDNGAFKYLDAERFHAVPTITVPVPDAPDGELGDQSNETVTERQILDVAALAQRIADPLPVVAADEALATVAARLADVELLPDSYATTISNSKLQLDYNEEQGLHDEEQDLRLPVPPNPALGTEAELLLDTKVSLTQVLECAGCGVGEIPVVGPGAKISVTLDPEGIVTELHYVARGVTAGGEVEIVDPASGPAVCRDVLGVADDVEVSGGLVYYAPAPTGDVVPPLLPHFDCKVANDADLAVVPLSTFVPAVQGWSPPEPDTSGGDERSEPEVGTDPVPTDVVSDVVGQLPSGTSRQMGHSWSSAVETGSEGATASPDCAPYVKGWRDTMATPTGDAGVSPSQFMYLPGSAWAEDFKYAGAGGTDHYYADDVDALFYCGHGGKGLFTFDNADPDGDTRVTPDEMRLGDWDLEWFFLLSCQVLREDWTSGSWSATWGQSFEGIHAMYGFHTNAYASGNLGTSLAKYLRGIWPVAEKPVHESFVQASIDSQPDGTVAAALYPVSTSYEWNRYDWYWNVQSGPGGDVPDPYYFVRFQWNA